MSELERALVLLGRELDLPAEPDLRRRVRERIKRRRYVRPLGFAVALLVVAFGIALAVPQARSAILDFFHIGSVTVERVETLPAAKERPLTAGLGPTLTRREAEQQSGVPLLVRGQTQRRFYARPGLIATMLEYRGRPVLLAELLGDQTSVTKKLAPRDTHVEFAGIGTFGLWITGGKHLIIWDRGQIESARLAANVLLWTEGRRTFRLEGDLEKGEMLQLGRDITR